MPDLWSHGFGEGAQGSPICARCGRDELTHYILKNNETICKRCFGYGSSNFLTLEGSWNSAMRRDQFDIREETVDEARYKFATSNNRAVLRRMNFYPHTKFQREKIEVR